MLVGGDKAKFPRSWQEYLGKVTLLQVGCPLQRPSDFWPWALDTNRPLPQPSSSSLKRGWGEDQTRKPQVSKGVAVFSCSLRLRWRGWGGGGEVEIRRAPLHAPGVRHPCLSGNHCVCLLCPFLPSLPVPTLPYPLAAPQTVSGGYDHPVSL